MLSICYNKIPSRFTIIKIITYLMLSVFSILLIPIITLHSILNYIFNRHKKHLKSPSLKSLKAILMPKQVSSTTKTGSQTLKDIQNINIEINGHEVDINYIKTKLNEYTNYKNVCNIPQRMLYHIEYISQKCNITHEQTRKEFFDRIILALVLEDLITEYQHKTTNNIPHPKLNPQITHEIITRCNIEHYLNAPKHIISNILNLKDNLSIRRQDYSKIQVSLDTTLFTPQNGDTIICTIKEEMAIPEKYQRHFIIDQEASFITSSLTFTLDAESQENNVLYNNISFEFSIPNNFKRYTAAKTCCMSLIKKSKKTTAVLSEIDTYNGRTYFLYDFPDLQSFNSLSLNNNDMLILNIRNHSLLIIEVLIYKLLF